jgi:molybdate transport system ATP-binding protein
MNEGLDFAITVPRPALVVEAALTARAGEVVVLAGPSGSGKSTLLAAIAGLVRPQRGSISIQGRTVFSSRRHIELPPWRRRVGFVFQDYALFPHLTVLGNVRLGSRGRRPSPELAQRWLDALHIGQLAQAFPAHLSGGQRQRVALARAAASDCDLLLLDEPFGALDPETRRAVRAELRAFLAEAAAGDGRPRTAVIVSHDFLDALTLGDRVAVLEAGRLTQVGTREELSRRPRTAFLAELSGHNVLEGTLLPGAGRDDARAVQVGPLTFWTAQATDLVPGPVFVGFGPEAVSLLLGRSELSARNQFPAVVQELSTLPGRVRIYLDAGAPIIADVVASAVAELGLRPGCQVLAAVKSTAVEVYR